MRKRLLMARVINKAITRKLVLLFLDICAICFASFMGLFIRFDFSIWSIPEKYYIPALEYLIIDIICSIIAFKVFNLYKSVWRMASLNEMLNAVYACTASTVVQMVGMYMLNKDLPRSYHFIYFTVLLIMTVIIRFSYRFLRILRNKVTRSKESDVTRCLLYGAGRAGDMILRDLEVGAHGRRIIGIIDDNKLVWGKSLRGIEIIGGRECLKASVDRYDIDEILIAIPSADIKNRSEIIKVCQETGCRTKILPNTTQLLTGEINVSRLRDINVEDLIGRESVCTRLDDIMEYVAGRTVLVTGGGGSIGSEICRQIAAHEPKKLIILDIYENNAYDIQCELKSDYNVLNDEKEADPEKSNLDLEVVIASVRDVARIDQIFDRYRPDIVYHAAAHKHVPLMEASPNEAIKNNVFGTLNVARMADKWGTKRFVLISTDKAVNPTNIMGASKRICEMIVQTINSQSDTEYVAVRFGNVLGSNGSVVPLFKKQIEAGGPITVTHPDIIRYFMTIPEAVSLVLQAGAKAKGGEIFVLNMGEPVKIVDLAKNLIKLSGHTEEEIPIVFTGLRPGEKLYEEMLMKEEGLKQTDNKLIFIGSPLVFDAEEFEHRIAELGELMKNDSADIRGQVKRIVDTYNYC